MSYFFLFLTNFLFALIFFIYGCLLVVHPAIISTMSFSSRSSDFCSKITYNSSDPEHLICRNKFKKRKFLWLLIDGLAYDQLFLLGKNDYYSSHTSKTPQNTNGSAHSALNKSYLPKNSTAKASNFLLFRTQNFDFKQSGSAHEQLLTGKNSKDVAPLPIKEDSLIRGFNRNGYKIAYTGSTFPLLEIFGKKDFWKVNVVEYEHYATQNFCRFDLLEAEKDKFYKTLVKEISFGIDSHLKEGLNVADIYTKLSNHIEQKYNKSLYDIYSPCLSDLFSYEGFDSYMYYTSKIDHNSHFYDKYATPNILNVFFVETLFEQLKNWVRNGHEDYAVILSSDHGSQSYNGEDLLCLHGCNEEGNEGVIAVYTKEMEESGLYPNLTQNPIDLKDSADILSQFFEDINIPLETQGVPRFIFNDKTFKFATIKSKEKQLLALIEAYFEKAPENKMRLKNTYEKLKESEFGKEVKSVGDVEKMSEEFFDSYLKEIIQCQNEVLEELKRQKKSSIFYILKLFLPMTGITYVAVVNTKFLCGEIRSLSKKVNNNKQKYYEGLILFLLFLIVNFEGILVLVFGLKHIKTIIDICRMSILRKICPLNKIKYCIFIIISKIPT